MNYLPSPSRRQSHCCCPNPSQSVVDSYVCPLFLNVGFYSGFVSTLQRAARYFRWLVAQCVSATKKATVDSTNSIVCVYLNYSQSISPSIRCISPRALHTFINFTMSRHNYIEPNVNRFLEFWDFHDFCCSLRVVTFLLLQTHALTYTHARTQRWADEQTNDRCGQPKKKNEQKDRRTN